MPTPGPLELVIILVIALIILGPGKLPDVGASLGKSIREFRKASSDIQEAATVRSTRRRCRPMRRRTSGAAGSDRRGSHRRPARRPDTCRQIRGLQPRRPMPGSRSWSAARSRARAAERVDARHGRVNDGRREHRLPVVACPRPGSLMADADALREGGVPGRLPSALDRRPSPDPRR